jgi:hypothetical protein
VEVEIERGRGEGTVLSTPSLLVAIDDVVVVILWYGCCVLCRVLHLTGILFSLYHIGSGYEVGDLLNGGR